MEEIYLEKNKKLEDRLIVVINVLLDRFAVEMKNVIENDTYKDVTSYLKTCDKIENKYSKMIIEEIRRRDAFNEHLIRWEKIKEEHDKKVKIFNQNKE